MTTPPEKSAHATMSAPAARGLRAARGVIPVRRAVAIGGVIAVVATALLVAVGVQWRQSVTDSATDRARTELRRSAGEIVAQVFSVTAASWQADRDRARGLVGGEFARRYATELTRPPADGAVRVTWRPDVVGVVAAEPDRGTTLIRASVETVATPDAPPITEKRSVQARFDRDGDIWQLTGMEVLS
ncbi:hypothetical protein GIY30_03655 [Gordonia sp. HNM0687]|uniref:Mammalian cell entry protein n=2 Tax=Gordonia mangrovi TaxID=2665643 RepID=A0A6L7GLK2_9ACTN|nr:hypothetical protein [Gordonia mangrovi]